MGEVSTVRKKKRLIKTICFGFVLLASSTFFIALAAYKDGVAEYWEGDYEKTLSNLSKRLKMAMPKHIDIWATFITTVKVSQRI